MSQALAALVELMRIKKPVEIGYITFTPPCENGIAHCTIRNDAPYYFSSVLLKNLRSVQNLCRLCNFASSKLRVRVLVLSSERRGVFSLGGDLEFFCNSIEEKKFRQLLNYGRQCLHLIQSNVHLINGDIIIISFVDGDCLGGGFESVLSTQMITSTAKSRFGFPEHIFDLFPGMGAHVLLNRMLLRSDIEHMIDKGGLMLPSELIDAGLSNLVVVEGLEEVEYLAKEYAVNYDFYRAKYRALNILDDEYRAGRQLDLILKEWVELARRVNPSRLRVMRRLVSAQVKRYGDRAD